MDKVQHSKTTRPTIRDVAAQAGVSVSSVSRVLNGGPHTSPELHARIMRAVNRLGFEPHYAAQALRSRSSNTVGCMVSDISNPLYSEMISAADEEFQKAGHVLMLGTTRHEEDRETSFLSEVRRRRMDGLLVLAGDNSHDRFLSALAASGLPCVGVDREMDAAASVCADHRRGGLEVARYLISLGHRRIAFLMGPSSLLPTSERLAGYKQAFVEAKLDMDPDLIRPQESGTSLAFSDASQLLQSPSRPTAIVALGTHMLAGVMDAMQSNGLRCPEDVSLVCVGDTDLARHASPSVTALTWDFGTMGRLGASLLLGMIQGRSHSAKPQRVLLPTELILRRSCAAPAMSG